MLLGGIRYLLPVIKAAHEQGYYVITADYLPDNIAHKFSDEYVNVNVVDKDAVLVVAKEKQIDGIMSFGVDPGVVAASYVQNQMGLPSFGPYESVEILQNKDKFRQFLAENGFNVPKAKSFSSMEEALRERDWYEYPVIVKPTDSAGSKGVTRVDCYEDLNAALDEACKAKYAELTIEEIKELLVNRKWYYTIFEGIKALYVTASHNMANRIIELAERYEYDLPWLAQEAEALEAKVKAHLERMGFVW